MDKATFVKAMIAVGRTAMLAKLGEWFGAPGTRAAEKMTTPELAEVMWGIHKSVAPPVAA
jgi:hypothetical protein